MLLKQNKPKAVKGILFTGLLTLLASCGGNSTLEGMVRADPKLRESSVNLTNNTSDSDSTVTSTPSANSSQVDKKDREEQNTASNNLDQQTSSENALTAQSKQGAETELPDNFPASLPIYPKASLKEAKVGEDEKSGMLTWTSSDNSKAIADYYQAEFIANNWEIIKPFNLDPKGDIARAIAVKGDRKVHLTLLRSRNKEGNNGTKLTAIYEPQGQNIASSDFKTEVTSSDSELQQSDSKVATTKSEQKNANNEEPFPNVVRKKQKERATNTSNNGNYLPSANSDFADLDDVPEQLMQPLETVAALGILTPYTQEGNVEVNKFAPNAIITRGEYARWLIAANNRYYEGDSGKKIYVSNNTNEPAFQDIKGDNPDFGAIQGLAEAGLVASRLTQDSTKLLFRPEAPLTREDLVTWKVPLDTRQALPQASIEALQESWGFQDAANIDSSAIRALYADYQNGERSNVRRVFGFTTLFQPNKPVTRAEAAASLWYFGFQGDGITAQEILESETETESNS